MTGKYDDIIHLPHHVSSKRVPMSNGDRAAQFSPFAALTGYDDTIAETARLTEDFIELAVGGENMLDEQLRAIREDLAKQPEISVRYFCPDQWKHGGAYVNISGRVKKIDEYEGYLQLTDGTLLYFSRIHQIER